MPAQDLELLNFLSPRKGSLYLCIDKAYLLVR
jgi:hypothetical protein